MTASPTTSVDLKFLRSFIIESFLDAVGLAMNSIARVPLRPVVWTPAHLFASLGASFDNYIAKNGFDQAARWVLPRFSHPIQLYGQENIPVEGPLILASNHPGNIDALALAANLPRNDLKILALDIPFVQGLPNLSKHFIYSNQDDASMDRMLSIRMSIRHLRDGGSLLIFPAGHISPDPAVLPGAEKNLTTWSRSLELFLRKAPAAKLQLAMLSHITLQGFYDHPITRRRQEKVLRQILAQHLQVASQLVFPRRWRISPNLTFAAPLTLPELQKDGDVNQTILAHAQNLLREHAHRYGAFL